jgi:hypothetical protein
MRRADAVIAVSPAYLDTMRERYPGLDAARSAVIPFGVSEDDVERARRRTPARSFDPNAIDGASIGRGGPDMATALEILFRARCEGAAGAPRLAATRLSFVGTDYAPDGRARQTVAPLAGRFGLAAVVEESTTRVAYLDALSRMIAADFLVLLGSDDPQYSPSKLYPYLAARRPIVAVVHERSPIIPVLRRLDGGDHAIVTFAGRGDVAGPAARLTTAWSAVLDRLPFVPDVPSALLAPFCARELTARQCRIFDVAVAPRLVSEPTPCTE